MNLIQIYINDDSDLSLSEKLKSNTDKLKSFYPNFDYHLFSNESCREFIKENYEYDVLWAYDYLVPYSYKADLAKACILYKMGGLYVDLGVSFVNKISMYDISKFIIFKDVQKTHDIFSSWAVAMNIIYCQSNVKFLKDFIDSIVENCKNKFYGKTPICPTGPILFGKCVALNGVDDTGYIGEYLDLTPHKENKNYVNMLKNGNIVAFAKGNTLFSDLGVKKVNEYTTLWKNKEIYSDDTREFKIKRLYKFLLNREADKEGLNHYVNSQFDLREIESQLKNSSEYKNFNYTYLVDKENSHLGGNFEDNDWASYSELTWKYIIEKYNIKSSLDVGSGRGFSSKYFESLGVDITAIDGLKDNVENSLVPTLQVDLTKGNFLKEVDFVNCVEVVEHIEEKYINNLLDTLCNGKYVLITHAFPGQEGWHHVNCQPSEYWIEKFSNRGYTFDKEQSLFLRKLADMDGAAHIQRSALFFIRDN
jgi:hypothetical protein